MLKNSQIFLILAILLSIDFFSISAKSQEQVGDLKIEPFNESLIKNNIVILIDSSESTKNIDSINGSSINNYIAGNAISLIRGLGRCTSAGVVTFGAETRTTDMLSMSNDTNKKQLETFIKEYGKPKPGPTLLNEGLKAAEDILNSVTGTKEILIISDGLIDPDSIYTIKNTVLSLKNNNTNIQFIQVIDYDNAKMPTDNYERLAKAAGTKVILLYPDERVSIISPLGNASNANEPCISPTPTITSSPTTTINETSIPSSLSTPENQMTATRAEEIGRIRSPGFEGIFTIFLLYILFKIR